MIDKLMKLLKTLHGDIYLQYYITYLISPMLTGIKPASLIGISNDSKELLNLWKIEGKNLMDSLNLKTFTLKKFIDKEMVLIYNESDLNEVINIAENNEFLQKLGYENLNDINIALEYLHKRYNQFHCPHEIGIFLGIPLKDVEGFINCNNRKCILCGYWKVFSNEQKARELFKMYDSSKEMVAAYLLEGKKVNWIASTLKGSFHSFRF